MPKLGATVRQTDEGESVGPKIHTALVVLSFGARSSKHDLATTVGPHGSTDYGYRIVNRLVKKNLAVIDPEHEADNPHGMGVLILTAKGARYLNEHADTDLLDQDACRDWSRYGSEPHWADAGDGE